MAPGADGGPPPPRWRWRRWLGWTIVGILAAGAAAALAAVWYSAQGGADLAHRFSTLGQLSADLVAYAREHGRYPLHLTEVRASQWADVTDLEYAASGKRYPLEEGQPIFYERTPKRYGFTKGRIIWYQRNHEATWEFVEGENTVQEPGGW
jgi:hypothetical protein